MYVAIRGTNVRGGDKRLAEQLIKFLETVDVTLSYVCSLRTRVDLMAIVADDADRRFLPTVFTPRLAAIVLTHISSILYDATHRPRKGTVILVVHGLDESTMNRSVRRGGPWCTKRRAKPLSLKSFWSPVATE